MLRITVTLDLYTKPFSFGAMNVENYEGLFVGRRAVADAAITVVWSRMAKSSYGDGQSLISTAHDFAVPKESPFPPIDLTKFAED